MIEEEFIFEKQVKQINNSTRKQTIAEKLRGIKNNIVEGIKESRIQGKQDRKEYEKYLGQNKSRILKAKAKARTDKIIRNSYEREKEGTIVYGIKKAGKFAQGVRTGIKAITGETKQKKRNKKRTNDFSISNTPPMMR